MGYCKICRQRMDDPFDCDCRCERCGQERWFCERHGCEEHDG